MSNARTTNASGFTTIELLITICVIAMLISIAAPSLSASRGSATSLSCANNLRHLTLASQMYANDNSDTILPMNNGNTIAPLPFPHLYENSPISELKLAAYISESPSDFDNTPDVPQPDSEIWTCGHTDIAEILLGMSTNEREAWNTRSGEQEGAKVRAYLSGAGNPIGYNNAANGDVFLNLTSPKPRRTPFLQKLHSDASHRIFFSDSTAVQYVPLENSFKPRPFSGHLRTTGTYNASMYDGSVSPHKPDTLSPTSAIRYRDRSGYFYLLPTKARSQ